MDLQRSTLSEITSASGDKPVQGDVLMPCCIKTLGIHSTHNPMMVCPECKQIIKVFSEESPFRNYIRFCESRHRKVFTAKHVDQYVVVFRSYDTFNT